MKSEIPFKDYEVDGSNITFDENNEFCTWYGTHMNLDACINIFGLDLYESFIDLEHGFIMIRGSLDGNGKNEKIYINGKNSRECFENFIAYLKRENSSILTEALDDFLLVEPIPESFNLEKIIQFEMDLDDHYKQLRK